MDWQGCKLDKKERKGINIYKFHVGFYVLISLKIGIENCENKIYGKYTFKTEQFGTIDFFPASNRLFFRSKNKWIDGGSKIINKITKFKTKEILKQYYKNISYLLL